MFTSSCILGSRGTRCSRWCRCGCRRTVSDTAACGGGQAGPVSRGAGLWLHSKQVGGCGVLSRWQNCNHWMLWGPFCDIKV